MTIWTQANSRRDVRGKSLIGFPACKARRLSAFAMTSGLQEDTITIPLLDADLDYDFNGDMWDSANQQIVLTQVGTSGLVRVVAYVEYAASAAGERGLYLIINGSSSGTVIAPNASASKPTRLNFALPLFGSAIGDTFKLGGYQSSGGNLNVTYASLSVMVLP